MASLGTLRGAVAVLVLHGLLEASAERSRGRATKYVLRALDYGHCPPEMGEAAIARLNMTLRRTEDGSDTLDADADVVRSARYFSKFKIVLNRCVEAVTANSCEYFQTLTWTAGVCTLLGLKGMVWTPFIESISPPVKCPFKAGFYQARNISLDVDSFLRTLPVKVTGYVWMPTVFLWGDTEDNLMLCFHAKLVAHRVFVKRD